MSWVPGILNTIFFAILKNQILRCKEDHQKLFQEPTNEPPFSNDDESEHVFLLSNDHLSKQSQHNLKTNDVVLEKFDQGEPEWIEEFDVQGLHVQKILL